MEIAERDHRIERYPAPRQAAHGGEKAAIDLLEIGDAAGAFAERFAPVVAHRRGFPPRLVGGLPAAALGFIARQLGGTVEAGSLVAEARTGGTGQEICHHPALTASIASSASPPSENRPASSTSANIGSWQSPIRQRRIAANPARSSNSLTAAKSYIHK